MKTRYYLLFTVAGLFLVLSWQINNYHDYAGFLANVSTELFGLLITLLLIDEYVRHREAKSWKAPKDILLRNIQSETYGSLSQLMNDLYLLGKTRHSLLEDDSLLQNFSINYVRAIHSEATQPIILQQLPLLNIAQLDQILLTTQRVSLFLIRYIDNFNRSLAPKLLTKLLKAEEATKFVEMEFDILASIINDDELDISEREDLKQLQFNELAIAIKMLVDLLIEIHSYDQTESND